MLIDSGGQGEAISFLLVLEPRSLTASAERSDSSVPIDPPDNKEIKERLFTKSPKSRGIFFRFKSCGSRIF